MGKTFPSICSYSIIYGVISKTNGWCWFQTQFFKGTSGRPNVGAILNSTKNKIDLNCVGRYDIS